MTVLIVLAMVISFLIIDYVVQLRNAPKTSDTAISASLMVSINELLLPDGVFALPGHLWAILQPNGKVKLGIDRLIAHLIGTPDKIILPKKGASVKKGELLVTIGQERKMLRFISPIDGVVVDVNDALVLQPNRMMPKQMEHSWLIALTASDLSSTFTQWRLGEGAKKWLKSELARMMAFLNGAAGQPLPALTMQDGGMPLQGVMRQLDSSVWQRFESEFLSGKLQHEESEGV